MIPPAGTERYCSFPAENFVLLYHRKEKNAMVIRELSIPLPDPLTQNYLDLQKNGLFFDIETTGLSWRSSHLYMIGAAFRQKGGWTLRQWFLEKPQEEKELLEQFSAFCRQFSSVIHYNGQTFDLPYLIHKYSFYQLDNPFSEKESLDLYRILRPWQRLLGLSSLKQRDAEAFLGISREDVCSGEELISCYHKYLRTGAGNLLELLFLHNRDDVLGLMQLLPLLGFQGLRNGQFSLDSGAYKKGELLLSLHLSLPLPSPVGLASSSCRLSASGENLLLSVSSREGELKHFFDSYKDYYYLPQEDCAVHKSVGAFVDREFRQRATARTCYQKCSGIFLPQPEILVQPAFYQEYGTSPAWFLFQESFLEDSELLLQYARSILHWLLAA